MQSLQGREGPVLTAQGGTTGLAALEAECGTWMGGGCTKPLRLPLCTSNLQKVERKAESERGQNALVPSSPLSSPALFSNKVVIRNYFVVIIVFYSTTR